VTDAYGENEMNLFAYEGKIVRVTDIDGKVFTGFPVSFPPEYGYHEFNRDEKSMWNETVERDGKTYKRFEKI